MIGVKDLSGMVRVHNIIRVAVPVVNPFCSQCAAVQHIQYALNGISIICLVIAANMGSKSFFRPHPSLVFAKCFLLSGKGSEKDSVCLCAMKMDPPASCKLESRVTTATPNCIVCVVASAACMWSWPQVSHFSIRWTSFPSTGPSVCDSDSPR